MPFDYVCERLSEHSCTNRQRAVDFIIAELNKKRANVQQYLTDGIRNELSLCKKQTCTFFFVILSLEWNEFAYNCMRVLNDRGTHQTTRTLNWGWIVRSCRMTPDAWVPAKTSKEANCGTRCRHIHISGNYCNRAFIKIF